MVSPLTSVESGNAEADAVDAILKSAERRAHRSLSLAAVCLIVAAAALVFCPFDFYWRWVWPLVSYTWPFFVSAFALSMAAPGICHHRRTGTWVFLRQESLLLLVSILASVWLLTTVDAAEWSWTYLWFVGLLWALAGVGAVFALMAYFECWRWCDRAVQTVICQDIMTGQFHRKLKRCLHAMQGDNIHSQRRHWGSLYVLAILMSEYNRRMVDVVRQIDMIGTPAAHASYVRTAECLVNYLSLDWPEKVMNRQERIRKVTEIRRQLLTLAIWFARHAGVDAYGKQRLSEWLNGPCGWNRLTEDDGSPYSRFLRQAFLLAMPSGEGMQHAQGELLNVQELGTTIKMVMDLFLDVPQKVSPGAFASDCDICAMTWLAIASHIPWRVRFDTWLQMCEQRGVRHRFEDPPHDGEDPAERCARRALHECYLIWSNGTSGESVPGGDVWGLPRAWRLPIRRLAQHAEDASKSFARIKILRLLARHSKNKPSVRDKDGRTAEEFLRDDPDRDFIMGAIR